jgi:hypothetical protein
MNIDDYYFIRCEKPEHEKFSSLENMLKDVKGVEVQYSFPYLSTIAAKIDDKNLVEDLVQKGYSVEKQNRLLALPSDKDAENKSLGKLDTKKP